MSTKNTCAYCGLDCAAFAIEVKSVWYCSFYCSRMAAETTPTPAEREKAAKRFVKRAKLK
jgi:hypothetical protein